jgi:Tol biopolymer transport system component
MTALTHKQARQFVLATSDGLLADSEQQMLAEHLRLCADCQGYQAELNAVENRLQTTFRKHREIAPTPQRAQVPGLQTQHRRNAMNARLSSVLKFAFGSVMLTGLVILMVTSLLNAKNRNITPTAQAGLQTPIPEHKVTPTLEATQPEIDLSTGQQNGDWIAFITSIDELQANSTQMDVYLIHPDGSGLKNLTNAPAEYSGLEWSPDGKWLAFLQKHADSYDLKLFKPQDGSLKILVGSSNSLNLPSTLFGGGATKAPFSWSPNSYRIAFVAERDRNNDLFVINADGSGLTQLTKDPGQETGFVWSPNGNQIAYESSEDLSSFGKLLINVVNANGGVPLEVAHGMGFADLTWAQDGKSVYATTSLGKSWLECEWCLSNSAIYRISLDGKPVSQIFHAQDSGGEAGISPAISNLYEVSPNTVYFEQQVLPANRSSWMRIDGAIQQTVRDLDAHQVCLSSTDSYLEEHISPNKMFSLVIAPCAGEFDLYFANRQANSPGKFLTRLLAQPEKLRGLWGDLPWPPIAWSPDGHLILIQTEGTGGDDTAIHLLNVGVALQDPTTQSVSIFSSKSSIFGISWQPALAEKTQTSTPSDRLVAFASSQDGNSEIYVTRTDGSGAVNLTNNPAYDGNPVWSPDGKQLAFESDRDGNRDIFVMNADGSELNQLTHDPGNDILGSWAPDGSHLAFFNDQKGFWLLYAMTADGNSITQLTEERTGPGSFFWSPEGKQIAYYTGGNNQIDVINVDGTNRRKLTTTDPDQKNDWQIRGLIKWSQDEQSIYYSDETGDGYWHILKISTDGTGAAQKIASGSALSTGNLSSSWLENDSILHYVTDGAGMNMGSTAWYRTDGGKTLHWDQRVICKISSNNSGGYFLSHLAASHEGSQAVLGVSCPDKGDSILYFLDSNTGAFNQIAQFPVAWNRLTIDWSADDRLILINAGNRSTSKTEIYLLNAEELQKKSPATPALIWNGENINAVLQPAPYNDVITKASQQATPASPLPTSAPLWTSARNGNLIAFVSDANGNPDIYLANSDGSNVTRLPQHSTDDFDPVWSPDGNWIAFANELNGNYSLHVIHPDGSNEKKITDTWWGFAWSPDSQKIAYLVSLPDNPSDVYSPAKISLKVTDLNGNTLQDTPLGVFNQASQLRWSQDGQSLLYVATQMATTPNGEMETTESNLYQLKLGSALPISLIKSDKTIDAWTGTEGKLTYLVRYVNEWDLLQGNGRERKKLAAWGFDQIQCNTSADQNSHFTWNYGSETATKNWSPDGKYILFQLTCDDGNTWLYFGGIDGKFFKLLNYPDLIQGPISWSSDGKYIVFTSDLDAVGNLDIYKLDVEAALKDPSIRPIRITTSGFTESSPDWQPKP